MPREDIIAFYLPLGVPRSVSLSKLILSEVYGKDHSYSTQRSFARLAFLAPTQRRARGSAFRSLTRSLWRAASRAQAGSRHRWPRCSPVGKNMTSKLLSPSGELRVVRHDEITAFCKETGLRNSNVRVLLGISGTSNLKHGSVKAHEKNWVQLGEVRWLHRDALPEPLFTVGATQGRDAGMHFASTVAAYRLDMRFNGV